MILGTSPDFTGWVVDYGVFPEQPGQVFKARDASPTYGDLYPGGGEAALFCALRDFVLPKVRAAYINYIYKLGKVLDKNIAEEDMGLDDYV